MSTGPSLTIALAVSPMFCGRVAKSGARSQDERSDKNINHKKAIRSRPNHDSCAALSTLRKCWTSRSLLLLLLPFFFLIRMGADNEAFVVGPRMVPATSVELRVSMTDGLGTEHAGHVKHTAYYVLEGTGLLMMQI